MLCLNAWLIVLAMPGPSSPAEAVLRGEESYRVLLVGDSWSEFFWLNGSLGDVFTSHGHSDILEKGDATTIAGSTAAEWVQTSQLQLIADELAANPTIDIVQLTMGGNDFLAGMADGGWYVGISAEDEEALVQRILGDIQVVVDFILNLNPNYTILLSFYDYPNFEDSLSGLLSFSCLGFYNDLNQPTTLELNQAFRAFNQRLGELADQSSRIALVDHTGLMQFAFGFPGDGILPETIIPPGNLNLPSPIEAMFLGADCIHLSQNGYLLVAQNLWENFYKDQFCVSQITLAEQLGTWPAIQNTFGLTDLVNRQCPL